MNDDIGDCDTYFIQIHIPTEEDGTQDLTLLESILKALTNDKPIWIRTTILPGTSEKLSKRLDKKIYHMPEFLTKRTELLKKIFPGKKHIVMSNAEAEMVKYAHNVFGALKVTYFNCIYDICQKRGLDYGKVREGVLGSTYINVQHTHVPGQDVKPGIGGKYFPKYIRALEKVFRYTPLELIMKLNEEFRSEILL